MITAPFERNPSMFFPNKVRKRFEVAGKLELIQTLEGGYAATIARRRDFVQYGDPDTISERERALANVEVIRQVQLHRAERLMASCGTMIAERNIYGLVLLMRGHYESTAVLGYLCNRVDAFVKGNILFETIIQNIGYTMMGGRHDLFANMPDPTSIMTAIEKADHFYERQNKSDKKGMLADCYAWLSEFAHPNFNSNYSAMRLNQESSRFEFLHGEDLPEESADLLGYLDISVQAFIQFFDNLQPLSAIAFAAG